MMNSKHFSLEEWADFGRGRTTESVGAEMERHLSEGCARCARVLGLWKGVLDLARQEEAFEPPANAVRCAKALYAAFPPAKESKRRFTMAHLAGFPPTAMEGVRAAAPSPNHFLFKAGDLLLDIHLQPQSASETISIVGQVLDCTHPDKRFENQPVALVRRKDALARTTTNEFGEFRLEFKPDEDLLLMIELDQESYLVSRLPSRRAG